MDYHRSYEIDVPVDRVAAFHRRAESLRAITPPLLPMRFEGEVPEELVPGDELTFRTWLGPLPVRWRARVEELEWPAGGAGEGGDAGEPVSGGAEGFQDRQLDGPFGAWLHRHRFTPLGPSRTRVDDRIEARLARHLLWGPAGLKMSLGLPLLFAYREWKTRRLLERG